MVTKVENMAHENRPSTMEESLQDPSLSSYANDYSPSSTKSEVKMFHRKITVEPIMFFFQLASNMVFVTSQDLMIKKSCEVNFNYAEEVCSSLSDSEQEEVAVQTLVSDYLMWRSILEASLKIVSIPFLAWWGDTWGRKCPLIMCLTCLALESGIFLLNTLVSSWPLEAILASSFFYAFSGGTHSLLMLLFSVIAESSTAGKRTFRMAILDGFYYLGSPIGLAIAPPLFQAAGYVGIFSTSILIYVFSVLYVIIRLPRGISRAIKGNSEEGEEEGAERSCNCGVDRYSEAFYTTFKPRPNKARKFILLLIVAMLFDSFVIWGEGNVKYLFTQKALDWDYNHYNYFGTACGLIKVIGAFVVIPLLSLKTPLEDMLIGCIGAISRAIERGFYASATAPSRDWLMYIGAVTGIGSPLAPTTIRSQLSKLSQDDIGQIFAVMAVGETVLPFAAAPLYSNLYQATISSFPGAFYLVSCAFNLIVACILMSLFYAMRAQKAKELGERNY